MPEPQGRIYRGARRCARFAAAVACCWLAGACSVTKHVPQGSYLLTRNDIRIERNRELSKQERRLQQKEESLDKKMDAYERKEDDLTKKQAAITATQNEVNLIKRSQMEVLEKISGLTQEEAAQRVSRSRPAVANAMRLLALPQEVQWLIEQGNLSAGHGRALLSLPTPEEQIAFAEEIMAHHWSVRETEERIRRILHQMNQPDEPKEDTPLKIYFQEAERKLTADLGRKVTISQGKKKGKIALEYYDQEDLELLMQALATLEARKEGRAEP